MQVADPRVGLMFRTGLATGLAISDMVTLRLEHLKPDCIIEKARVKSGKIARIRIEESLYRELKVALPFYEDRRTSGVTVWTRIFANTFARADIADIKDGQTHRWRDSYVDAALSVGTPIVIAAATADLISTLERHYCTLDSFKMRQQILLAPVVHVASL